MDYLICSGELLLRFTIRPLSSGEYMTFKASDMDLLIEWLFNPVYSSILFA